MPFAFNNQNLFLRYFIYQPVFAINPSAPVTAPISLKWFGFPNAFEWVSVNVTDQHFNALNNLRVGFKPLIIFVKGGRRKAEVFQWLLWDGV